MKFFAFALVLLLSICIGAAQTPATPGTPQTAALPTVTHGPVLEYVSDHDAVIAWTTKDPSDMGIHFGTTPTTLTAANSQAADATENPHGTNHRVKLDNLQPNTTYYIQVTTNTGQPVGNVAQFQTVAKGAAPKRQNVDLGK